MEVWLILHLSEAEFPMILIRRKWGFNLFQKRTRAKTSSNTVLHLVKWSFVPSLGVKRRKILRKRLSRQSCAKNIGKVLEVKIKLKPPVRQ